MSEIIVQSQKRLLEMAKIIRDILESHHIPYMITYGTLLGAVRHKGFIPWDDDFDFFLFDDTYEHAIECLRKEMPEQMFLEDEISEPLYFHAWAHIKDTESEVINLQYPQDGLYSHKGLSIDLYRTRRIKYSELEIFLAEENRKYILRRKEKGVITQEEYARRMRLLEDNLKTINAINYPEDFYVYNLLPIYKWHYMKVESVFPLRRYKFEDCEFWGPNDANTILTNVYGDYMSLPPEEKRIPHYSSVITLKKV